MSITIDYLGEPKLQFARYFEHEDSKTGLAEYGPFGRNIPGLHPSEIKLGFIGTRETIAGAREWIEACGTSIESENVKVVGGRAGPNALRLIETAEHEAVVTRLEKILNPDFVGLNRDSPFCCCFQTNERWDRPVPQKDIDAVLAIEQKDARIWRLVDLFEGEIESLASTSPSPTVIVVALTPAIVEQAHAVRISGNFYLNFRRALKGRAMKWGIPIQLLQRRTVVGKGSDLQEKATRAWNFCTAQYYKADGVPWRPAQVDRDTCFVGISFYVARDVSGTLTMQASVAQAFDYLGQGLVLRGDPFEWDAESLGPMPHLTRAAARELIKNTLSAYMKVSGIPPRRVVIHKSSDFWGSEHGVHDEREGFHEGIAEVFPRCDSDFVALRKAGVRLFREGRYPPLRGTYFCVDGSQHFLYTMGYVPYLATSPSPFVPEPWLITQHHGSSAPKALFREILALTKMNVNNCAFADGTPITLSFSRMVGEIMKHVPQDGPVQPNYKFYM